MKHSRISISLLVLSLCLLLLSCANPVAPEGGPKDTKPPKVLKSDPPDFSANFKDNSIKIDFDEFIALKNQAAEVNVSPPLKTLPDLKLRGKSLIVKIDDTLAANTTYSIDFGKSISDITENNILTGFSYTFSTGPYIDSLSLRGNVMNAFDLTTPKDVFALLYIDRCDTIPMDSLPMKVKPYYVTKINEKGEFQFHNLRSSPMKLTALADLNGNLIFDQAQLKAGIRATEDIGAVEAPLVTWYGKACRSHREVNSSPNLSRLALGRCQHLDRAILSHEPGHVGADDLVDHAEAPTDENLAVGLPNNAADPVSRQRLAAHEGAVPGPVRIQPGQVRSRHSDDSTRPTGHEDLAIALQGQRIDRPDRTIQIDRE